MTTLPVPVRKPAEPSQALWPRDSPGHWFQLRRWRSSFARACAIATSVLFLGVLCVLGARAEAAEISPVRIQAPNGLTVLILEQHALPVVHIHALVKAGSAQDPPGKAGLASLVAGLLDEGTKTRTANQLSEQIDFVGGSLSADAYPDFTTASAQVLAKDTDLGFELLSDILLQPAFPEREFTRVRNQILGEIQSEEDEPGLVAEKAFNRVVFGGHPYRWPVDGTTESLNRIAREDLRSFHAREYVPNQTILAVVGDVTVERARALIETYFGKWRQRQPPPRSYARPGPIAKPVVRLIDKELTQSTIILGHLGISRTNSDYYAIRVMNYILGAGGFSSRLMDSIRDKQGLAYGVYSSFDANLMPGAFSVSLQTRTETTNKAITGVLAEINGIREEEVTDQELDDAKAYLIGSFPLRLDTLSKLTRVLTLVEFYGLGPDYFDQYPSLIQQVTTADVMRVARRYLHPTRYALVVVGDQKKAKVAVGRKP